MSSEFCLPTMIFAMALPPCRLVAIPHWCLSQSACPPAPVPQPHAGEDLTCADPAARTIGRPHLHGPNGTPPAARRRPGLRWSLTGGEAGLYTGTLTFVDIFAYLRSSHVNDLPGLPGGQQHAPDGRRVASCLDDGAFGGQRRRAPLTGRDRRERSLLRDPDPGRGPVGAARRAVRAV